MGRFLWDFDLQSHGDCVTALYTDLESRRRGRSAARGIESALIRNLVWSAM